MSGQNKDSFVVAEHKEKRAARCARNTAERRADCARHYARACDARTDTRIVQDAARLRPDKPPRYGDAKKADHEVVVMNPLEVGTQQEASAFPMRLLN